MLDSTGTTKEGSALPQDQVTPSAISLRRTCAEVSVGNFRKAHGAGDLTVLIISGTPDDQQLLDAWNEIVFELGTLIHTDENTRSLELLNEINFLDCHTKFANYAVRLLRFKHNQIVVDRLIGMGYPGNYDHKNQEAKTRQLNRIISLCKTKLFDLDILRDEYNRIHKINEGKKQSDEDFLKNIVMLKQWGYRIDMNDTMMDEYAQAMNLYMSESRAQKNVANV